MNSRLPLLASVLAYASVCASAEPPVTLPTVKVEADASSLIESAPVGIYGQPDWVRRFRFATTKAYIARDPWEVGTEQWWRFRHFENGDTEHLFQHDFEIGLPYRLQLDAELLWGVDAEGDSSWQGIATELRWALADWNVIPWNPTLFVEYQFMDESAGEDALELQLLLARDVGEHWHVAANALFEMETTGPRGREVGGTLGITRVLMDGLLSLGLEAKLVHEYGAHGGEDAEVGKGEDDEGGAEEGEKGSATEFLVGPSVQWSIGRHAQLNFTLLFGCTDEAPQLEGYVVFNWEFEPDAAGGRPNGRRPVSSNPH